jgi:hypothetical protein
MFEYVYKLNFPLLPDILLDSAKKSLFDFTEPTHKMMVAKELVKPEWLIFNNIEFEGFNFFYKPNFIGLIHSDEATELKEPTAPCVWGINWIHNGSARMEYWTKEMLDPVLDEPDSPEYLRSGYKRIRCSTNVAPIKVYDMMVGAYLVNASVPHRASGFGNRYAVSLRPKIKNMPWLEVVDNFKNYIIN